MSVVDTNVLVHATITTSPDHARADRALARLFGGSVSISRQIVREYLSAVTRSQPFMAALSLGEAVAAAQGLVQQFNVLEDGPDVWAKLLMLGERFSFGGKQVHDANIVATMLARGETTLLTFNAKDFRRFAPLIELIEP